MNRVHLLEKLREYKAFNLQEDQMRNRMIDLILRHENCFSRELLIAHFTASCWVTNERMDKVLLIHHAKLNKWLQPGGHCDGNENVLAVAIKELQEETGILGTVSPNLFDIDIHSIPERKGVPEHEHFDIRFHFIANERDKLIQNHETNGLKWVKMDELEGITEEESILRMKAKTILLPL